MIVGSDFLKINEVNYKWAGELQKRSKTDMIVLHHAEASSCSAQNIHQWHLNNGWIGFGYHYLIRKDGSIYTGRPEWAVGAHAQGYNSRSIGVCFEGRYTVENMPSAQIKAGQELISYLKNKYHITDVKKHCEVNNTDCPGKNFPFSQIVNSVAEPIAISALKTTSIELPILKKGVKCAEVGTLQILLRSKGYSDAAGNQLVVDNSFGPKVDFAVRKFQKEKGLEVDGSVGKLTWTKLLRG